MNEAAQLAQLAPAAPLPAAFAIAPDVVQAAAEWPLTARVTDEDVFLCCSSCDQAVLPLAHRGDAYRVRITDLSVSLLAHLQQRHGWTREVARGD